MVTVFPSLTVGKLVLTTNQQLVFLSSMLTHSNFIVSFDTVLLNASHVKILIVAFSVKILEPASYIEGL